MVEKGEIAHLSNFTFFHNVFPKLFFFKCVEIEYIWRKGLIPRKVDSIPIENLSPFRLAGIKKSLRHSSCCKTFASSSLGKWKGR